MARKSMTPVEGWHLGTRIIRDGGSRPYGSSYIKRLAEQKTHGPWDAAYLWGAVRLAERLTKKQVEAVEAAGLTLFMCQLLLALVPTRRERQAARLDPVLAKAHRVRLQQFEVFVEQYRSGLTGNRFRSAVIEWNRLHPELFSHGKQRRGKQHGHSAFLKKVLEFDREVEAARRRYAAMTLDAKNGEKTRMRRMVAVVERLSKGIRASMKSFSSMS